MGNEDDSAFLLACGQAIAFGKTLKQVILCCRVQSTARFVKDAKICIWSHKCPGNSDPLPLIGGLSAGVYQNRRTIAHLPP